MVTGSEQATLVKHRNVLIGDRGAPCHNGPLFSKAELQRIFILIPLSTWQ